MALMAAAVAVIVLVQLFFLAVLEASFPLELLFLSSACLFFWVQARVLVQ